APSTAILAILGSMILSAIPPLSGFQAEWAMFIGIFEKSVEIGYLVAFTGIFATFLTLVYTFWPIKRVFFGQPSFESNSVKKEPPMMVIPLFILSAISILFGVYPDFILRLLTYSSI
ncbi:MAG: hypothetical protein QXG51_04790, partial [Nitrososphaerota archaeon]